MKMRFTLVALSAALVAGCAAPQATVVAPANDPLGLGDAETARYKAQAMYFNDAAISRIEASSTRAGAWFSTNNLTDESYRSAWGPAADDAEPSLLVTLTRPVTLSAIGLKLSDRDITFDVATANTEGGFTTIATDMRPEYMAMDYVTVPTTSGAIQVKLTFHVPKDRQLLVCELKLDATDAVIEGPGNAPVSVPATSHHFFAEGIDYAHSWGPIRFREGGNEFKLTFKSNVDEAHTRFLARLRTADGQVLTTFTYESLKETFYYDRNYSQYSTVDFQYQPAARGKDYYFEVEEATGYYQFVLANDGGYITDHAR